MTLRSFFLKAFAALSLGICCMTQGADTAQAAASVFSEQNKIHKLIESVRQSNAIFYRNGLEYDCISAADHLEMKLYKAEGQVKTALDFIEKIGTASYLTGVAYKLRLPSGEVMPAKQWLLLQLHKVENAEDPSTIKGSSAALALLP